MSCNNKCLLLQAPEYGGALLHGNSCLIHPPWVFSPSLPISSPSASSKCIYTFFSNCKATNIVHCNIVSHVDHCDCPMTGSVTCTLTCHQSVLYMQKSGLFFSKQIELCLPTCRVGINLRIEPWPLMMPVSPSDISHLWLCHPPWSHINLLPVLGACQTLAHLSPHAGSSTWNDFLFALSMAGPFPSLNLILNFTSLTIFLKEGSLCFLQLKLISFFLRIIGTGCCLTYLSLYFIHLL